MSDSGSPSPDPDTSFETTIISSLVVHTKGLGKKATETKSIKVKEFDFAISEDNYLEFLRKFLEPIARQVSGSHKEALWFQIPLSLLKVYGTNCSHGDGC
jgi:hypothetical protein